MLPGTRLSSSGSKNSMPAEHNVARTKSKNFASVSLEVIPGPKNPGYGRHST